MGITIDYESKRLSNLLINIDNHRLKYKKKEKDLETNTNINIEFVSPFLKVYEHFKFYLLKNSVKKILYPKFYYRPDYVSFEEYNTTVLWTMLLFINDVPSIEHFDIDQILVPTKSAIDRLTRDLERTNTIDLDLKDLPHNDMGARLFRKKMSPTYIDISNLNIPVDLTKNFYFIRQSFPIRNITVSQKYIDLKYAAVPESINFKIKDQPSFIYGDDYVLILNSGVLNRVTWNNRFAVNGLESLISEGMIAEVTYAKEQ